MTHRCKWVLDTLRPMLPQPVRAVWEADDRADDIRRVTLWTRCPECGREYADLIPLEVRA